jgi:hypothetical protein
VCVCVYVCMCVCVYVCMCVCVCAFAGKYALEANARIEKAEDLNLRLGVLAKLLAHVRPPSTLHPKPSTLNPNPETRNLKP